MSDRLAVQLPSPEAITHAAQTLGTPQQTPATASNPYMDLTLGTTWLPGSDTCLVVTMPLAVLVYDLAHSARQPLLAVIVPGGDLIASSAVGTHMVTDAKVRRGRCGCIQPHTCVDVVCSEFWLVVTSESCGA